MPEDMQLVKTLTDRETFLEDLFRYKFYCASNFYEDNIGSVEVVTLEGGIITTTFQIPPFTKHLTQQSRDLIPYKLNKVSQQEKLEMFVSEIELLVTQMNWQMKLG